MENEAVQETFLVNVMDLNGEEGPLFAEEVNTVLMCGLYFFLGIPIVSFCSNHVGLIL
jgi:hypothetical protein